MYTYIIFLFYFLYNENFVFDYSYAFIFYDCHEKINTALSLNGSLMGNKEISVELGRTDVQKVAGSKPGSSVGPIRRSYDVDAGGKIARDRRTSGCPY